MKYTKIIIIFLILANVMFLIYIMGLGYYNNLLLDDYRLISDLAKYGIFRFIWILYNEIQGRFGMFILSLSFLKLASGENNLLFLTIIQLLIGVTCLYLFLRLFFAKYNKFFLLLVTIFVLNLSILGLFKLSTFFWVCTSAYITLIFLTFLLIWFIFNDKINKYIGYFSIFCLSFIIGGGVETYTPLVILCLGAIILLRFKTNGFKLINVNQIDNKLIFATIFLCLFFILMIIAPGNNVRMQAVLLEQSHFGNIPIHPTGLNLIFKTSREMVDFLFMLATKIGYYLLALPIFYSIGNIAFEKSIFFFPSKKFQFKHFFLSLGILFSIFWISILPGVYALNHLAPERSFSFVSFLFVAFVGFWGVILGNKYPLNKSTVIGVGITCMLITCVSIYFTINEFGRCRTYQQAIKTTHENLITLQKNNFKGIARVKPIDVECRFSSWVLLWNFVMDYYKPSKKITSNEYMYRYFPYEFYSLYPEEERNQNRGIRDYLKLDFDIAYDRGNCESVKK